MNSFMAFSSSNFPLTRAESISAAKREPSEIGTFRNHHGGYPHLASHHHRWNTFAFGLFTLPTRTQPRRGEASAGVSC
jgi:hypothetical protein